ncbi:MAG: DUF1800 domain-containing protein [Gemmataceae bacterium]|nr:DUF1800 domain-containing protein [Gemmataceae bacterium]
MPTQTTWDATAAAHLLSRAAFASTPQEAARLAVQPLERAVDGLLEAAATVRPPAKPDWVQDPWVNTERVYPDTTPEARRENHRKTVARQARERQQLRCWWLKEMITTPAPLREVMTLFWHGHFTTATNKVFIAQAIYEQNATLRKYALGNFRDFLGAITRDAAMMLYLDLEDSDQKQPNENYARELLELFTLGEGNYTERDIKEIARALTGWTLDAPPGTPKRPTVADAPRAFSRDGLVPKFLPERHDSGAKTVLGQTGRLGAQEVIDLLVRHEQTGRLLATKLIAFFGVSDPENALRDRMARAFREGKFDVRPMLRELLVSPEFYAKASRGNQIKSPVQLLVGACRQLQLEVEPTPLLAQATAAMGQELFCPPNVKGWPGGKDWISTGALAVRYHLPESLFDGKEPAGLEPIGRERFLVLPADEKARRDLLKRLAQLDQQRQEEQRQDGIKVKFTPERIFPKGTPEKPEAVVDALLERLLVLSPRPDTRDALIETCRLVPKEDRAALVARLILMTPEYQLA